MKTDSTVRLSTPGNLHHLHQRYIINEVENGFVINCGNETYVARDIQDVCEIIENLFIETEFDRQKP